MITLKIGRNEYFITNKDRFMDNGACVQLLTQSKEPSKWGRVPNPVLSKLAVKEIASFERVTVSRSSLATVFSLGEAKK